MSLVYSGAFRTPAIRKLDKFRCLLLFFYRLFGIPPVVKTELVGKNKNAFKEVYSGMTG